MCHLKRHIDITLHTAPEYLTELFASVTDVPGRRHLRSAARGDIVMPRTWCLVNFSLV